MTKSERELLGALIKKIRASDAEAWADLKDQIADYGYQSYYPAADYYRSLASKMIARLPADMKKKLVEEWRNTPRLFQLDSEEEILNQWVAVVVDEIVIRATAALR